MYTNVDYDRRSLNNALSKGDYARAFEKVNENITIIDNNLAQIREYSFKIGSKQENSKSTEETNELIENTTNYIIDTMNYLSDIKNFDYTSNVKKNENILKAKYFENTVQSKKNDLQSLINSIKNQGQEYINNARNSLRIIEERESENKNNDEENDEQQLKLLNGREYIEGIHDKENQINIIVDVTQKLNEISKFQAEKVLESGQKINSIEDNVNQMSSNIANAVEHMKEAKKYNESAGGYTNYCLYIIGAVVLLLILLVLIMPSS